MCFRTLQSQITTDLPVAGDSSASRLTNQHFDQRQHRQDPAERPADCITHYLMSLGQLEPTHTERMRLAAEREGNAPEQRKLASVQLKDTPPHPDVRSQRGDQPAETSAHHQNTHVAQSQGLDKAQSGGPLLNSTLSQCDVESVWSDMSTRSDSTFDTRAEVAFRDGLSALDASIASLQRTIQLDLRRHWASLLYELIYTLCFHGICCYACCMLPCLVILMLRLEIKTFQTLRLFFFLLMEAKV